MNMKPKNWAASYGKIVILFFALLVLWFGIYSHFMSSWTEKVSNPLTGEEKIRLYQVCEIFPKETWDQLGKKCPPIFFEYYFISVIIVTSALSLLSLPFGLVVDTGVNPVKFIDAGYHALCAVALLAGSVLYILSATQIEELVKLFKSSSESEIEILMTDIKPRTGEKITAAALTIVHSLLYGVVTFLILRK